MNPKQFVRVAILAAFGLAVTDAVAKSITVPITGGSVSTFATAEKSLHVFTFSVPEQIRGKRLDSVLLEFYVDAALVSSADEDEIPTVGVRPLTSAFTGAGQPAYTMGRGGARPIVVGQRRRVVVDITDTVKGWLANPSTNHGLIVGSLGEHGVGDLSLRSDVLGDGRSPRPPSSTRIGSGIGFHNGDSDGSAT